MADTKSIRLNDGDDPDRADKFSKSLKRSASNGNQVIRQLVDAYNRYVTEHGRSPTFPVAIVPIPPTPARRKA